VTFPWHWLRRLVVLMPRSIAHRINDYDDVPTTFVSQGATSSPKPVYSTTLDLANFIAPPPGQPLCHLSVHCRDVTYLGAVPEASFSRDLSSTMV
jgi:hypothetical protein